MNHKKTIKTPLIALLILASCASTPETATEPQPRTVCVVRHAEAYKNLNPPPPGLSPETLDSLTPQGEAQAQALGDLLAQQRLRLVWTSPAGRTRQTAALLARDLTPEPQQALLPLAGALPWDDRIQTWAEGRDPRPEGGEALADGATRVRRLLDDLQSTLLPGETAVLVTHGDIAALLLGELDATPLLERPAQRMIPGGELRCLPLDP